VHPRPFRRVGVRAEHVQGRAQQRDGPVQFTGRACRGGGLAQQLRLVARGQSRGVRHRRPEGERGLQVLQLLGGCADAAGLLRRLQRRGQRPGQVVALAGVVRPLGRCSGTGRRGEIGGDRRVQAHALPRQ
jgi:hypothetical protein